MKFWSKFISCAVALFMVSITCLPALAAQTNISIYLPEDQLWSTGFGEYHYAGYLYMGARCHSVFPTTGSDNFHRIQCSADTLEGVRVTKRPYVVLTEGSSTYEKVEVTGTFKPYTQAVYFKFRGNSSAKAQAIVSYTGSYLRE